MQFRCTVFYCIFSACNMQKFRKYAPIPDGRPTDVPSVADVFSQPVATAVNTKSATDRRITQAFRCFACWPVP